MRPIIFLEFDNVVCQLTGYSRGEALSSRPPEDLADKLFHPPSVEVLQELVADFNPVFVLTKDWLHEVDLTGLTDLLKKTTLKFVSDALHPAAATYEPQAMSRAQPIHLWLQRHHQGEPFVILDPMLSWSDLPLSPLAGDGRVTLCEIGPCLNVFQLPGIRAALSKPCEQRAERSVP